MKLIFPVLATLLLLSCKDHTKLELSDPPINQNDFISVLMDIHLVDAMSKQKLVDDNRQLPIKFGQYKRVFVEHNITKADFDSTMMYYTRQPEVFLALYDTVIARYQDLEAELDNK